MYNNKKLLAIIVSYLVFFYNDGNEIKIKDPLCKLFKPSTIGQS